MLVRGNIRSTTPGCQVLKSHLREKVVTLSFWHLPFNSTKSKTYPNKSILVLKIHCNTFRKHRDSEIKRGRALLVSLCTLPAVFARALSVPISQEDAASMQCETKLWNRELSAANNLPSRICSAKYRTSITAELQGMNVNYIAICFNLDLP